MTEKQWDAFMDWYMTYKDPLNLNRADHFKKCWEACIVAEAKEKADTEWKPKRGELVLARFRDTEWTVYGVAASETEIYSWDGNTGIMHRRFAKMKPFDPEKLGKRWSEI